ncbi:MAG: ABC transporter substrate-binding protein [Clostridiales bacterium]|nr:ABC transporter substrate-binding protein [Clostridiales bacterium]
MKRRLIILLLAAPLLLSLWGCAGQPGSAEDTEETEEDLIVVGVCQVGAESDWRVANSESIKAVFTEENGYELLFEDAKQKQENQISAIRKFIQQKVDYIVLMPISETGWDSVLQEAKDAGIPVIMVDRTVDVEDESLYTAHVGSDFEAEAEMAVAWMEETYGDDQVNIVHIRGTLDSTAQLGRTKVLEEAVEAHDNWTILTQLDGDFTQPKSYEVMCEYLSRGDQDIHVVYCENDNEAYGAIEALEEYGYTCGVGGVSVISFDATSTCLTLCLEGKIALAVECNPLLGDLVEEVIQALEAGGTADRETYVEEQCFTQADLTEAFIAARAY